METRSGRFSNFAYNFESAKILRDNDNYEDALKDHAYAKYKKQAHEDGYEFKVNDLKQFFAGTGAVKKSNKENKE